MKDSNLALYSFPTTYVPYNKHKTSFVPRKTFLGPKIPEISTCLDFGIPIHFHLVTLPQNQLNNNLANILPLCNELVLEVNRMVIQKSTCYDHLLLGKYGKYPENRDVSLSL